MPDATLPLDHMSDRAKDVLADHHKLGSQFPAPNFGGEAILVEFVIEGSSVDLSEVVGSPIVAPTNIGLDLLGSSLQLAIEKTPSPYRYHMTISSCHRRFKASISKM